MANHRIERGGAEEDSRNQFIDYTYNSNGCVLRRILANIAFRKQLAAIATGRTVENREIMSIAILVAGILLIVFGLLAVLNIIHVND